MGKRHVLPGSLRSTGPRLEIPPKLLIRLDIRPLKTEDRLLFVAHHEQRRRFFASTLATPEIVDQRLHDRPLIRAGVLAFVDQQVIDALIQLVAHPIAGLGIAEKVLALYRSDRCSRARHPRVLSPLIGLDHRRPDSKQRRRLFGDGDSFFLRRKRFEPRLLALEDLGQATAAHR